jgi:hypothetical protein
MLKSIPDGSPHAEHIHLEDLTSEGRQQQVIHCAGAGLGQGPQRNAKVGNSFAF